MSRLTGSQHKTLLDAVLSAFSRDDLPLFLFHRLDVRLDEIAGPAGLRKTVGTVLDQLDEQGRIPELLAALEQERPRRSDLLRVIAGLRAALAAQPASPGETAPPSPAGPLRPIAAGERVEVFYSYSHKDERLLDKLRNHLTQFKREGLIADWHDRRIGAGSEWKEQIDRHLDSARVILLLVSADFLASDYCYDVEMRRALERHDAGEARVIPVILRAVDWQGAPFGKLQALPKDGKPVTTWSNRDAAYVDIARGIRQAVEGLRNPR